MSDEITSRIDTRESVLTEDIVDNLKKKLESHKETHDTDFYSNILKGIESHLIEDKKTKETIQKNEQAQSLMEEFLSDPKNINDPSKRLELIQDIKDISVSYNMEIKMLSEYQEEDLQDIKTYTLPEESPFKVFNDPEMMLLRNGLITIGGKTSMGKTSLATHLALEIMKSNMEQQDEKTCFVFFSLDDGRKLGHKRVLTQILQKNYMRRGSTSIKKEDEKKLKQASYDDIAIFDKKITLESIEPTIKKVKRKGKYKNVIVCIDYIQKLKSQNLLKNSDNRTIINNNLAELKDIQKRTDSFFMILSQLNRSNDDTDYKYRESSEIENVSDVCIDISKVQEKVNGNATTRKDKPPIITLTKKEKAKLKAKRIIEISKNKIGITGKKYDTTIGELLSFATLKDQDGDEDDPKDENVKKGIKKKNSSQKSDFFKGD